MPTTRKPNHDAQGNNMAGQEVNYNATTGDAVVIGGYTWKVVASYNHGIMAKRGRTERQFTYRELLREGAFFAELNLAEGR